MASQLGSEIIDYYSAPERGGLNAKGVEIEFVLISTEVQSFNDTSTNNLSQNNGFTSTLIDATNNRMSNIRAGFSFFRGVDSSGSPGSLPFAQRRRIVILNNTDPGNPVILYNELPLSSGALGAEKTSEIRTIIDSADAVLPSLSFADWVGDFSFPPGLDSPGADPDRDGASNIQEFFAGTDPLSARSIPFSQVELSPSGPVFKFQIATDREETLFQIQTGTLDNFTTLDPGEENVTISTNEDGMEIVSASLPPSSGPFFRILLTHP